MRILYLCPDLGIPVLGHKGASVHVREFVNSLGRAGHRVVLAAQMLSKSPWEKPSEIEVPVLQVRPALSATAAVLALKEFNEFLGVENSLPGELRRILYNKELETDLKRRFENDPPDFIYERASLYATAGVALARSFEVPLILELNAPLAVEQEVYRATGLGALATQAERWMLSQADAVIVVSSALREHVSSLGVNASRIHVLPNGVNPALFHPGPRDPNVRARWKLDGGPTIGFTGGLRPWHGVESLPVLLERLTLGHPDVRLVIAGDGPLRGDLERTLGQHGLRERTVITGLVDHPEIAGLLRQLDIALAPYPATDHPFYFSPLKLFEYMACGIAVVVPELGQIAEVVRDRENGLLYQPGDLDGLVARCEELLTNQPLRQNLGQAAAQFIHSRFTWDHNASRVLELAQSLCATHKRP